MKIEKSASSLSEVSSETYKNGLGHVVLDDLEPETRYYYEVEWESETVEKINSGLLSFGTTVKDSSAWTFAVCADPKARPHINQRMSELIWEERPNFLLNLGDLTDGGKAPHRFEWTFEYFAGMGALHQRIPVFPVAGNGESDLVWYRHYHSMEKEAPAYYTFTYGNAQFFILNSNEKQELKPGGEQFQWLERELRASEATWKFVAHHHAPFSSDEDDYGDTWEEGETDMGERMDEFGVMDHEELGAQYLLDLGFSKRMAMLVKSHVVAKRYLTAKRPGYYDELSEASKETLKFQGGPMNESEVESFENQPEFQMMIALREWDDEAKYPDREPGSLQPYREMAERVLGK